MNLYRSTVFASLAAAVVLAAIPAFAYTDGNAELKGAAADRAARVVITGKATPPARTAWVPVSAKKLDGFRPVLPPEPQADAAGKLAQAPAGR